MILSPEGTVVVIALLLVGRFTGGTLIGALFMSLAFGCTAVVSVPALGDSTPLISTIFELLLVACTVLSCKFFENLGMILCELSSVAACLLAFYAIASAIILPQLFGGDVTTLAPIDGIMAEVPLAPSNGNFNQTAYLLAGIAVFLSLRIFMGYRGSIQVIRRGAFALVITNVILGLLDLAGKISGTGDWLMPIRTAGYSMLIDTEVTGFWRIVGGCSEASAYGALCLASISFTYTYWRGTGSALALVLTVILFLLIIFSTSSTAYAGISFLALIATISIVIRVLRAKIEIQDIILFCLLLIAIVIALGLYLYDEHLYDSFSDLIQAAIFDKAGSQSGQERSYWNKVGLENFVDTYGLGIGMGSSRTSSLLVSVLSQLGIIGTLLFAGLISVIFNGAGKIRVSGQAEVYALISSMRAFAIGSLTAGTIAGSGADPGLLFFISLAVIIGCKYHLKRISSSGENQSDVSAWGSEFQGLGAAPARPARAE
jgi:O-Antigen ligase